jgi:tetratricopeptide (TPR) repeat protein
LTKTVHITLALFLLAAVGCKSISFSTQTSSENGYKQKVAFETVYYEANKQKVLNNKENALRLYHEALVLDPKSHATMYQLAKLYHQANKSNEALYWAEKTVEQSPYNHWYSGQLGQFYSKYGKYTESANVFAQMVNKEPDEKQNYTETAGQYFNAKNYNQSVVYLKKMQERFGIEPESSTRLEYVYSTMGKSELAVLEMEKLAEHFPNDIQYKGYLSEAYQNAGQTEKAIETLNDILRIDPTSGKAYYALYKLYHGMLNEKLAFANLKESFKHQDLDLVQKLQVISTYFLVIKTDSSKLLEATELADILLNTYPNAPEPLILKSDIEGTMGNFTLAREYSLKALDKDQSDYTLWSKLISIDERIGNTALQLEDAKKALDLFPNVTRLYAQIGYALINEQEYYQALSITEEGLEIALDKNEKIDLLLCQSSAYQQLNNHPKSDQIFDNILSISPYNSVVLNNYAYSLATRKEKLVKADSLIELALKLEPKNPFFLDTKAWIFFAKKEYQSALKLLDQCMELDSANPEYYRHAKEIFLEMGNQTMANEMQAKLDLLNVK